MNERDTYFPTDHFPNSVIPAGHPIYNTIIVIATPPKELASCRDMTTLSAENSTILVPVERGSTGEIWIGGAGVSTGYVGCTNGDLNPRFIDVGKEDLCSAIASGKSIVCGSLHGLSIGVMSFFRSGDQGIILESGANAARPTYSFTDYPLNYVQTSC